VREKWRESGRDIELERGKCIIRERKGQGSEGGTKRMRERVNSACASLLC